LLGTSAAAASQGVAQTTQSVFGRAGSFLLSAGLEGGIDGTIGGVGAGLVQGLADEETYTGTLLEGFGRVSSTVALNGAMGGLTGAGAAPVFKSVVEVFGGAFKGRPATPDTPSVKVDVDGKPKVDLDGTSKVEVDPTTPTESTTPTDKILESTTPTDKTLTESTTPTDKALTESTTPTDKTLTESTTPTDKTLETTETSPTSEKTREQLIQEALEKRARRQRNAAAREEKLQEIDVTKESDVRLRQLRKTRNFGELAESELARRRRIRGLTDEQLAAAARDGGADSALAKQEIEVRQKALKEFQDLMDSGRWKEVMGEFPPPTAKTIEAARRVWAAIDGAKLSRSDYGQGVAVAVLQLDSERFIVGIAGTLDEIKKIRQAVDLPPGFAWADDAVNWVRDPHVKTPGDPTKHYRSGERCAEPKAFMKLDKDDVVEGLATFYFGKQHKHPLSPTSGDKDGSFMRPCPSCQQHSDRLVTPEGRQQLSGEE
ncbi:MAG: hypothetical protein H6739_39430, partial [Alphaproteobacteria bacterium]|nr:hypothetical protein [Alphaproteobacteria bacterium]